MGIPNVLQLSFTKGNLLLWVSWEAEAERGFPVGSASFGYTGFDTVFPIVMEILCISVEQRSRLSRMTMRRDWPTALWRDRSGCFAWCLFVC